MDIFIFGFFLAIGIIDLLNLYKEKNKKKVIVYCCFAGMYVLLSFLMLIDIKIPKVSVIIENIIGFFTGGVL